MKSNRIRDLLNRHFRFGDILQWILKRPKPVPKTESPPGEEKPIQDQEHPLEIKDDPTTGSPEKVQPEIPSFILTTFFLRRCYAYLMKNQYESIAYLSGIEIGDRQVLDELITFEMEKQEVCYVKGDIISSTEALITLSDRGFCLTGTVHCHPGSGAGATHPSGIDYRHHQRLEEGGFEALGIIMTRDGYVRFYTHRMEYSVRIEGLDGYWVEDDIYKLELDFRPLEDNDVPAPAETADEIAPEIQMEAEVELVGNERDSE